MTDYLKLAEECGGAPSVGKLYVWMDSDDLARFAARVRAEERERCAKECDYIFELRAATGLPREASNARALAKIIRALPEEPQ